MRSDNEGGEWSRRYLLMFREWAQIKLVSPKQLTNATMDDKWTEIAVLCGTNVLALVVVVLLNFIAVCCSRNEDPDRTFRKYTVSRLTSTLSAPSSHNGSKITRGSTSTLMGSSTTGILSSNHGGTSNQSSKQQHGERAQKKHTWDSNKGPGTSIRYAKGAWFARGQAEEDIGHCKASGSTSNKHK